MVCLTVEQNFITTEQHSHAQQENESALMFTIAQHTRLVKKIFKIHAPFTTSVRTMQEQLYLMFSKNNQLY